MADVKPYTREELEVLEASMTPNNPWRRLLATAKQGLEDVEEFAQRTARAEKDTRRLDYIEQRRLHTYGAGWIDDGTPLRDLIDAARGVSTTLTEADRGASSQVGQTPEPSDCSCECHGRMCLSCQQSHGSATPAGRHSERVPSSEGGE